MGKKGAKKRVATKRASTEDMQNSLISAQRETEHEADMQMEESSTGKQEEGVGESSDSESLLSSVAAEKPRSKKKNSPKTADNPQINIDQETEERLVEWFKANTLFYNKCDKDFKDTAKKARLMETKAKEFGLTGSLLQSWFRNMRTVYTRLTTNQPKKSGSAVARLTARQKWTVQNFVFLQDFISSKADSRTIGQVATPKNDCDSDDSSVSEPADSSVKSVAPQQTNQSNQAAVPPTTIKKGKGKRTTIEDQLSSFMTNISASSRSTFEAINKQQTCSNSVRQFFCQYLTAEIDQLTDEQFYEFQAETMAMLCRFRQPRQNVFYQQVQPQQPSRPLSAPPTATYQQPPPLPRQQWQTVQFQPVTTQYTPGFPVTGSSGQQNLPERSEGTTGNLVAAAARVLEDKTL